MRKPGGYAAIFEPGGVKEWDTFTCAHCQFAVHVPARCDPSELGGFCRMCMRHICKSCTDKGTCEPFERKLEEYERKTRFSKAVGLVLRSVVFLALLVGTANAGALYLSWSDNSSDETSFSIQRATSYGGTYSIVATTAANVTTYYDGNLTGGQEYCYKIAACNGSGCSDYLGPVCQTALYLPVGEEFR